MKLMPSSSALWMMRTQSSWSGLPMPPNIIAPRQSGLTLMPVAPRVRIFMRPCLSQLKDQDALLVVRLGAAGQAQVLEVGVGLGLGHRSPPLLAEEVVGELGDGATAAGHVGGRR